MVTRDEAEPESHQFVRTFQIINPLAIIVVV
jgi:hypothetical protein